MVGGRGWVEVLVLQGLKLESRRGLEVDGAEEKRDVLEQIGLEKDAEEEEGEEDETENVEGKEKTGEDE